MSAQDEPRHAGLRVPTEFVDTAQVRGDTPSELRALVDLVSTKLLFDAVLDNIEQAGLLIAAVPRATP